MHKSSVILYEPTDEELTKCEREDFDNPLNSKRNMEDKIDKSSVISYKPTKEELANGEPDDFDNQLEFPWASVHAYLKYCYQQSLIIPPIDKLISTLKSTIFTNYDSLAKLSNLMGRYNHKASIPFGTYKSRAYAISFYASLCETADFPYEKVTDGMNAVIELGKDKRAEWLMGLDILHSVDDPVPIFSAPIFLFGTLVLASNDGIEPEMLFRLVINAIDSSLWLVFEFKRYTHVACDEYIIGEGDEWGKLFPDDVPFTAAKIADSVADSGIGKGDWPIPISPQNRICGGPGTVRAYEVDDDFLQKTIPAPSSACTPRRPPKKLNVEPRPRARHD